MLDLHDQDISIRTQLADHLATTRPVCRLTIDGEREADAVDLVLSLEQFVQLWGVLDAGIPGVVSRAEQAWMDETEEELTRRWADRPLAPAPD